MFKISIDCIYPKGIGRLPDTSFVFSAPTGVLKTEIRDDYLNVLKYPLHPPRLGRDPTPNHT